jgi:hypothetical protein
VIGPFLKHERPAPGSSGGSPGALAQGLINAPLMASIPQANAASK